MTPQYQFSHLLEHMRDVFVCDNMIYACLCFILTTILTSVTDSGEPYWKDKSVIFMDQKIIIILVCQRLPNPFNYAMLLSLLFVLSPRSRTFFTSAPPC